MIRLRRALSPVVIWLYVIIILLKSAREAPGAKPTGRHYYSPPDICNALGATYTQILIVRKGHYHAVGSGVALHTRNRPPGGDIINHDVQWQQKELLCGSSWLR